MPKTIDYYRRRRKIAITALGSTCIRCGVDTALEFDHINPATKRFDVSTLWMHTDWWDEILTRCQLLCHDCHLEKTRHEQQIHHKQREFTHGTMYAWMTKKCRCETCEPLRLAFNEERRQRRRLISGSSRQVTPAVHGTEAMYRRGCREQCCKAAHAEKLRQYREEQRARDGNRHTSAS